MAAYLRESETVEELQARCAEVEQAFREMGLPEKYRRDLRDAAMARKRELSGTTQNANHENNFVTVSKCNYVNSSDKLREYAKRIEPLKDYEDVVIHCDGRSFSYTNLDAGNKHEKSTDVSVLELAAMLAENPNYRGGDIRLISCSAGKYHDGAAQKLANACGVKILAPIQDVNIREDGKMFVFDRHYDDKGNELPINPIVWTEEYQRQQWKVFKPEEWPW